MQSSALAAFCAATLAATLAGAQPGPPGPYGPPPAPGPNCPGPYGQGPSGAPGASPYYPTDPGYHQHDGFYLRMALGPAYTTATSDDADTNIKGGGAAFTMALGGAVARNLLVYGEVWIDVAADPELRVGTDSGTAEGYSVGSVGVGPGVAYYTPDNIYVSGTVGLSQLQIQDDNGETLAETKPGIGVSVMVGKEWWVSSNWGIGVAGQLHAGSSKDEDANGNREFRWKAFAAGVLFSATYN